MKRDRTWEMGCKTESSSVGVGKTMKNPAEGGLQEKVTAKL